LVELSPPQTKRQSLGPYWRALIVCLVLAAAYLALIISLNTETARRSSAPPWYAWIRYPNVNTRAETIFLVLPAIVFAGWTLAIRRLRVKPLRDSLLLPLTCAAVFAMNVTMALTDGSFAAIAKPFDWGGSEYFSDVHSVHGVRSFLHGYVDNLWHYAIHTRTHPPGAVLFLYFVARLVHPGLQAAAWSAVAVTATAVIPFYLLARRIGGSRIAQLALAIYIVTPSLVIYGATSMDGVFLASLLWSMYFLYRLVDQPGFGISLLAGISLAISFSLSYIAVCALSLMLVFGAMELIVDRCKFWPMTLSLALSGMVVIVWFVAIYLLSGFDYLACLRASRFYDHFAMRTNSMTPGRYFDISFCNLIAFLIGIGFPAIVLWWKQITSSLKSLSAWVKPDRFSAAGVICILAFSFAKLFTHETERIWLFFLPPALLGAAAWINRTDEQQQEPLLEWAMVLLFAQTWLMQILLYTIW